MDELGSVDGLVSEVEISKQETQKLYIHQCQGYMGTQKPVEPHVFLMPEPAKVKNNNEICDECHDKYMMEPK